MSKMINAVAEKVAETMRYKEELAHLTFKYAELRKRYIELAKLYEVAIETIQKEIDK